MAGGRRAAERRGRTPGAAGHVRRIPQSRSGVESGRGQAADGHPCRRDDKERRPAVRRGHVRAAGADPVAWITANPGRIKSMHCKDWAPGKDYGVLFGEGVSPWAKIFAAAESTGGIEYYLIEQEAGPSAEQMQ